MHRPCPNPWVRSNLKPPGSGLCHTESMPEGLRDYRRGDPLRWIAWKNQVMRWLRAMAWSHGNPSLVAHQI